jgi:hypothetical protein
MATAASTSLVYAHNLTQQYLSKNDIKDDVIHRKLFERYGKSFYAVDFFENSPGSVDFFPYDSRGIISIEKEAPRPVVRVGSEIATGLAGADISFTIHADSLDANNYPTIRENETIFISATYQPTAVYEDREYLITDITGTTVTASPLNNAGTDKTASQISTAIPVGTYLSIGATMYAVGTNQPPGKVESYTTNTHHFRILKDSQGVEGAAIAAKYKEVTDLNGNKRLLSEALMKLEFDLQKQKAFAFAFGQPNDNASLTATSYYGGTNLIYGNKGVFTAADEVSMDYKYDVEPDYADFEYTRILMENRGLASNRAKMFVGSQFDMDLHRAMKAEIREYSGGSDLLDKASARLGIRVKSFIESGIEYFILPVAEFKDPAGVGLSVSDSYSYTPPTSALIIPDEMVSMKEYAGQPDQTIPNVVLGYVNYNGENRMNVVGIEKGMSGFESGLMVANDYDGVKYHMMCHMTTIIGGAQKWILMRKRK